MRNLWGLVIAVIVLTLVGCSGGGGSSSGDSNTAPTANAGPDQNVSTGSLVNLSCTGSDADGDLLTFSWSFSSKPSGCTAVLSNSSSTTPSFTADMDGTYVLELTVSDGKVTVLADSVTITATTANSAPTANAGTNQNVATGSLVTLNGSGSDADGDSLTYNWVFTSRPTGSAATLTDSSAAAPTFTADLDGSYVLSLTVNDGTVDSQADSVTITAATANSAPTAAAGADQNVPTGSLVTLDGSGSSDADGDTLSYSWSFVSMPAGSSATLSDATFAQPTFTADVEGNYLLSLVVNDGTVNSTADTVTVTATTEAGLVGFYDFSGTASDKLGNNEDFLLLNADLASDGTLSLNGTYDQDPLGPDPSPGYRAWTHLTALDYESFTINLDFKADDLDKTRTPLTMSKASRWLIVHLTTSGQLQVALNNYAVTIYDLTLPAVTTGTWYNLNVSYDGLTKEICFALDSTEECRTLDPAFTWTPLVDPANYSVYDDDQGKYIYGQEAVDYDKQLMFTNYSSGIAFHGRIDNIRIYDSPILP